MELREMRRREERNIQGILNTVFRDQLAVSVPGQERCPATANMQRPWLSCDRHAVYKSPTENACEHHAEKTAEAAAPLPLAQIRRAPGHELFNCLRLLLGLHGLSALRGHKVEWLVLRHIQFVVCSTIQRATFVLLLDVNRERHRTSGARHPRRAFNKAAWTQHGANERSIRRSILRSVDRVLNRVHAIRSFRSRARGGR